MPSSKVKKVGMPQWSEADLTLAKALQHELNQPERGLPEKVSVLRAPRAQTGEGGEESFDNVGPTGGGSDDIGDVSWNVPTMCCAIRRTFPADRAITGRMECPWQRPSHIKE